MGESRGKGTGERGQENEAVDPSPLTPHPSESVPEDPVSEALAACLAVIDAKKGEEIVVLDTRLHTLVDYIVVATAASGRQMKAIADEIARVLKRDGTPARGVEGTAKSGWVLVDAGDLIVHLFLPEARRYYDLEMMWGDVPRIEPGKLLKPSVR